MAHEITAVGTPIHSIDRADDDREVNAIRIALGDEAFRGVWAEGLGLEQVVAGELKHGMRDAATPSKEAL